MNREFIDAMSQLAQERNLNKDELLEKFEEALEQAYSSKIEIGSEVEVSIDPDTGEMEVLLIRRVVEEVTDEVREISLEDALKLDDTVELGMEMEFPVDMDKFTRIAIQTTKQVITQKIREAERSIVYEEYKDRGLQVLGFPCNQFGGQEPGSNEEIAEEAGLTVEKVIDAKKAASTSPPIAAGAVA